MRLSRSGLGRRSHRHVCVASEVRKPRPGLDTQVSGHLLPKRQVLNRLQRVGRERCPPHGLVDSASSAFPHYRRPLPPGDRPPVPGSCDWGLKLVHRPAAGAGRRRANGAAPADRRSPPPRRASATPVDAEGQQNLRVRESEQAALPTWAPARPPRRPSLASFPGLRGRGTKALRKPAVALDFGSSRADTGHRGFGRHTTGEPLFRVYGRTVVPGIASVGGIATRPFDR